MSEAEKFMEDISRLTADKMREVGEAAVNYAEEHGDYRDVTGRLRRSNRYKVTPGELTLYNEADYAQDVEARGHDVLSSAALFAETELKRIFS